MLCRRVPTHEVKVPWHLAMGQSTDGGVVSRSVYSSRRRGAVKAIVAGWPIRAPFAMRYAARWYVWCSPPNTGMARISPPVSR